MIHAIRTQVDDLGDLYSEQSSLDVTLEGEQGRSLTRQEFKNDTDVNRILQRFGVPQFTKQPNFGTIDWDRTLQDAYAGLEAGRRLYATLPKELQSKYPTEQSLLDGLASGQLATDIEAAANPPAAAPQPPSP